jgi:hypothetical protein
MNDTEMTTLEKFIALRHSLIDLFLIICKELGITQLVKRINEYLK